MILFKTLFQIYLIWNKIKRRLSFLFYNFLFKQKLLLLSIPHGENIKTYNGVPKIILDEESSEFRMGSNISFNNYFNTSWYARCRIRIGKKGKLSIGNNCGFNGVLIHATNSISIGNYVIVGGGTRIYDTNYHDLDWKGRRNPKQGEGTKTAPVIIEDDVFIGTNCIIGKGVTIGARSIIAAGSVVVKDIPADCIAGGNPCKLIRSLNNNTSDRSTTEDASFVKAENSNKLS